MGQEISCLVAADRKAELACPRSLDAQGNDDPSRAGEASGKHAGADSASGSAATGGAAPRGAGGRYLLDPQHAAAPISARYKLKAVIGRGAYAVTRVAVELETGRHFACKIIDKRRLSSDERRRVRREMQCMYHLSGHPNIVTLADAYEDDTYCYLVMELCSGGEMVDRLVDRGTLTEAEAATTMRSLLDAVAYAHEMGVMHRDIKIDNCLLLDASPDAPLKLVDWGYAAFVAPGAPRLHKLCGTCTYVAPEVVAGDYDERADVWSCGVVLYAMLSGRLPFTGRSQDAVLRTIKSEHKGVPDLTSAPWPSVSAPAKAAIAAMLTRDPKQRPSARDMLAHPWIATAGGDAGANAVVHTPEVLQRIRSFAAMDRLKKHAALFIARHLPPDQIRGLAVLFESLDRNHTGRITPDDLRQALSQPGAQLPADELKHILELADLHGEGSLDRSEFLAAALHHSRLEEEANMEAAFKHFDADNDGTISAKELAAVLAADGDEAPSSLEVAAIIDAVDEDGDGAIGWKEFKHMMKTGSHGALPGSSGALATQADCHVSLDRRSSSGYYDLY